MRRTGIQRGSKPLRRSSSLPRGTGPARRTQIKPRSAKKEKWQREERTPFTEALLEEFPWCQMQIEGVCTGRAVEVDEIQLRSAGGSATDRANCHTVCRACHDWKGDNPNAAEALGFYKRGRGAA